MNLVEAFEQFDAETINEFIRFGQEEHLHLEFKTVSNASLSKTDDKRNLARCLSGFANSSGGLVVWGVDARKNSQDVDCASAPRPIASVKLFASRLNELTGDAVSPIVDGIRHKAIELSQDAGFAVTLVPESDSGPYMAKLGEDRYYKRSGGSFYRLEHFDLEDMFGRRQKPRIQIRVGQLPDPKESSQDILQFGVQNIGRAVAKHVGFLVTFADSEIVTVHKLTNISSVNEGRATVSYDKNVGVIHPNGILMSVGSVHIRRKNPAVPVTIEMISYCEQVRAKTVTATLVAPLTWL
jgi:hypothetical protein